MECNLCSIALISERPRPGCEAKETEPERVHTEPRHQLRHPPPPSIRTLAGEGRHDEIRDSRRSEDEALEARFVL